MFDPPGRADAVSEEVLGHWNDLIRTEFDAREARLKSRFFQLDFRKLEDASATDAVKWPADPAEALFCVDAKTAERLCDAGSQGRQAFHDEYCEYAVISRPDSFGQMRPKRVEVTTELREWWMTVAKHDPERVRQMVTEVLGEEATFEQLYGDADPAALDPDEREVAFARAVAGTGGGAQPQGGINTERALFMTVGINGLDDLIYIVLFGSRPYALRDGEDFKRAGRDEIFVSDGRPDLACRHADPAAALGAYDAAFAGKTVAFDNPLGMYLRNPNLEVFSVGGEPLPEEWVSFSRGESGMRQRLVFGPGDEDDAFLDDIIVAVGASEEPLRGGYQLVRELEVGPLILTAPGEEVQADERVVVAPLDQPLRCEDVAPCAKYHKAAEGDDIAVAKAGPRLEQPTS